MRDRAGDALHGDAGRLWLHRLYLLGGTVLDADGGDQVQLRLQPLHVLLALNDEVLEELPRAGHPRSLSERC
jgi:hypothetical protein